MNRRRQRAVESRAPFVARCAATGLALALGLRGQVPQPEVGPTPEPESTASLHAVLPTDCIAVATVAEPARLVADLATTLGPIPDGLPPGPEGLLTAGMVFVRSRLGGSIERFVQRVAGDGLAVGLQLRDGRPVPLLVLAARRPNEAVEFFERLGGAVHREADGNRVLVSSSRAACDGLRDRMLAMGSTPSSPKADRAARSAAEASPALRGRIDLAALRRVIDLPTVTGLDAAGKLLFSPLLAALPMSDRVDLELDLSSVFELTARFDASALTTRWRELMAAAGGERPRRPLPADGLMQVALDRSLTKLLRRPERFLSESEALEVQSFLSIADAIDGAATSFVEDLMGGLEEPLVFTVLDAPLLDDHARSPLALPGLALSAGIANTRVESIMRRAAQVLTVIINGERAQQRQRPFAVRSAWSEHGKGLVAEPPMWRGPGLPPVEDGLSPTLLFGHGHVVLASTHAAADRVLAAIAEAGPGTIRGDRVALRGPMIAKAIERARRPLELQRMLDEGETASAAARFWDAALVAARAIRRLELAADYGENSTTLTLTLERGR